MRKNPVTLREDVEQALAGFQIAFRYRFVSALVLVGFTASGATATTAATPPAVSSEIIVVIGTAFAGIGSIGGRRALFAVAISVSIPLQVGRGFGGAGLISLVGVDGPIPTASSMKRTRCFCSLRCVG